MGTTSFRQRICTHRAIEWGSARSVHQANRPRYLPIESLYLLDKKQEATTCATRERDTGEPTTSFWTIALRRTRFSNYDELARLEALHAHRGSQHLRRHPLHGMPKTVGFWPTSHRLGQPPPSIAYQHFTALSITRQRIHQLPNQNGQKCSETGFAQPAGVK